MAAAPAKKIKLDKLADFFVGKAKSNPSQAPEIYRKAAYAFMGLAQDPQNARSAKRIAEVGLKFANASDVRPPTMNDFLDLLDETAMSYDEVGDDPMDLVARRREIHDERTPKNPSRISIAPESFNKDATLGRSAVIKWNPSADDLTKQGIVQSQNVAFWQGFKPEAQAISIDISLGFLPSKPDASVFDGPALLRPNVRPYAEIEFGSDGNRNKFLMDVGFGRRLTVPANYVSVTVGMQPPMGFGTPNERPSTPLTAGASLGTFAAPSLAPVTFTQYADFIPPGGDTGVLPIPLKAAQLLPVQTNFVLDASPYPNPGETYQLVFYDYGGNIITNEFYQKVDNMVVQPITIYGDMAFFRAFNPLANATFAHFRFPFLLAV